MMTKDYGVHKQNVDYEKLFTRALEKKIRMFYEALKWDMPVDKANTLERFFKKMLEFI